MFHNSKSDKDFFIAPRPYSGYRGFMLDTGRYYFPPEDIAFFLDLMSELNLNVFHWHISDDQGWRLESAKYPELTKLGCRRNGTNFSLRPHEGFYSRKDVKQIVSHANSLGIKVMPEFDIPGHTQALLHARPELGCFGRKLPVATHWGVKHDILCAGKESTFDFVRDILDEMTELFPDGMIHLGGDEAVKTRWKLCPDCQKAMRELGLEDEDALQTDFMNRAAEHLKSNGIVPYMWEIEKISPDLDPDIVIQCYLGDDSKTGKLIAQGRAVINSNSHFYYFDFPYRLTPLSKTVSYNPYEPAGAAQVMSGVEGCLWTEYVPDIKKAVYLSLPRLVALADAGWNGGADSARTNAKINGVFNCMRSEFDKRGINLPEEAKFEGAGAGNAAAIVRWKLRPLDWHGLHNLVDNAKVKASYSSKLEKGSAETRD